MATALPLADHLPKPLHGYWRHTQRPLVCLCFATPLLVAYELGVMAFPGAARNGADVWMRGSLHAIGLEGYFLLPLLTVGVLLGWHHTTRQPWRLPRGVLLGMLVESALLGVALLFLAQVGMGIVQVDASLSSDLTAGDKARLWFAQPAMEKLGARVIEYLGAGLYEEVMFRLLLLPALIGLLTTAIPPRTARVATAVAVSSLLFAAAHHVGAQGEAFSLSVFMFRTTAGVFFAMLFLRRGFGIAIGAHAAYDLLAGLGYQ